MPLKPYVCTNCGFWQRRFAPPAICPVCEDPRHPLPEAGYEFLTPAQLDARVAVSWREVAPGLVLFEATPQVGIGAGGYLLLHPEGNLAFEGTAWYSDAALDEVERLGGVRFLAASHMHVHGALWRLADRFRPEVLVQVEDLAWTKAFRVTWPFDERVEPLPGLELLHTGGHTAGHTVLHDRRREALFVGDMIKYRLDAGGGIADVGCQKAYDAMVPLSHGELRRYREVLEPLAVEQVFTPWEVVPRGGKAAALHLIEAQLAAPRPFADFVPPRRGRDAPALAAYRRVVAVPEAELFEFPIDPIDRLGVPVWTVMTWHGGPSRGGIGYGTTPETARLSAWGEFAESAQARVGIRRRPARRASWRELEQLGVPAVDPLRLGLPVATRYTPDRELHWIEGSRYPSGEPAWVPIDFAVQDPSELGDGHEFLIPPITNGLGAGDTRERAIAHGLLELLQRDGNSVSYRALDQGIGIEVDSVADLEIRQLLDRFDRAGVAVIPKLAATDFGLVNLYVVGFDRDPRVAPHHLTLSACGEAAHPDREVALKKALLEFASSRARKSFMHGPRSLVAPLTPEGYLERFESVGTAGEEARSFQEMRDWAAMDAASFLELIRPTLAVRSRVRLSSLPTTAPGALQSPSAVLATVTERLAEAGFEIVVVDCASPNDPAQVVRVIVPGLEVETMTYDRIGSRNLRRLLDRGADFVGLGAPPPGAFRVPMPPSEEERLGRPAWFSPEGARRALRGLYALYREPGRHAVMLANERGRA